MQIRQIVLKFWLKTLNVIFINWWMLKCVRQCKVIMFYGIFTIPKTYCPLSYKTNNGKCTDDVISFPILHNGAAGISIAPFTLSSDVFNLKWFNYFLYKKNLKILWRNSYTKLRYKIMKILWSNYVETKRQINIFF